MVRRRFSAPTSHIRRLVVRADHVAGSLDHRESLGDKVAPTHTSARLRRLPRNRDYGSHVVCKFDDSQLDSVREIGRISTV